MKFRLWQVIDLLFVSSNIKNCINVIKTDAIFSPISMQHKFNHALYMHFFKLINN
jgi:hypothetical protein